MRRVFGGDTGNNAIRVKGHGDLLVYRARCCNPIRGEDVVGYVTRGKGVAVHAVNCPNVMNLMYEPERRIDVEWARDEGTPSSYPVKLTVFCDDRFGMLKQITAVISDAKTNIRNIEVRSANTASQRRCSFGYRRSQASGKYHQRRAENSRRTRRAKIAESLVAGTQSLSAHSAALLSALCVLRF